MKTQNITKEQWLAVVQRAKFDPVWFVKDILGVDPDPWQITLLEVVADCVRGVYGLETKFNHDLKNKISVRSMHGPGKTFGMGLLMHWWNFCFNGQIPCTAPKVDQLKTRLWPAFRKIRRMAIKKSPWYAGLHKVEGLKITWMGDPDIFAVAETAANAESLAGYHDDFIMFLVDEAAGVPEEMWPVILGALSTGKCPIIVIIGNPTKNTGFFYDTQYREKVRQNWYALHIKLSQTTRVSRRWVKEMCDAYGEASPVVQVRCFGNAPEADAQQLVPLVWLEEARERGHKPDGSFPSKIMSIDVSDGGDDSSVITLGEKSRSFRRIIKQWEFNFPASKSPILLAREAEDIWGRYRMSNVRDKIVVDAMGTGAGTAGLLMEKYPVIPYKGGKKATDPNYNIMRAQCYFMLRNDLRDGTISLEQDMTDNWDDFDAQMCSIRRKLGAEKVEELEAKHKLPKSPDKADSLAMQYMAGGIATSLPADEAGFVFCQPALSSGYDGSIA